MHVGVLMQGFDLNPFFKAPTMKLVKELHGPQLLTIHRGILIKKNFLL
jgi:hypothetical protein